MLSEPTRRRIDAAERKPQRTNNSKEQQLSIGDRSRLATLPTSPSPSSLLALTFRTESHAVAAAVVFRRPCAAQTALVDAAG